MQIRLFLKLLKAADMDPRVLNIPSLCVSKKVNIDKTLKNFKESLHTSDQLVRDSKSSKKSSKFLPPIRVDFSKEFLLNSFLFCKISSYLLMGTCRIFLAFSALSTLVS